MPRHKSAPIPTAIAGVIVLLMLVAYEWVATRPAAPPPPTAAPPAALTSNYDRGMVYAGQPRPVDPGIQVQVLVNQAYTVGYSNERGNPLWVAYKLVRRTPLYNLPRPKIGFEVDDRTSARVSTRDYVRSGFSRGHMAPSHAIGEFFGREAQLQTFLMSNITPQLQVLNANAWEDLENLEIDYAQDYGTVWVIDGPVFPPHAATLRSGVAVPAAFYKLIVREDSGRPVLLAVLMPQAGPHAALTGHERPSDYLTTVDDVQKQSGLDFFWQLDDRQEQALESRRAPALWPVLRSGEPSALYSAANRHRP